jgi:hypothetical protein
MEHFLWRQSLFTRNGVVSNLIKVSTWHSIFAVIKVVQALSFFFRQLEVVVVLELCVLSFVVRGWRYFKKRNMPLMPLVW